MPISRKNDQQSHLNAKIYQNYTKFDKYVAYDRWCWWLTCEGRRGTGAAVPGTDQCSGHHSVHTLHWFVKLGLLVVVRYLADRIQPWSLVTVCPISCVRMVTHLHRYVIY